MRAGVRGVRGATGTSAPTTRAVRGTQSDPRRPKPRTAYELLERVCEHILEEPKRYYQDWWGYVGEDTIKQMAGLAAPACGTVACRAGWIVALHDGLESANARFTAAYTSDDTGDRANEILGLSFRSTMKLFDAISVKGRPGTLAYAKRGAAGLRWLMRTHEEHLKARLLTDVPKPEPVL